MYRGMTPTFTFKLPFAAATLTAAVVSFCQPGGVSIDRTLAECTVSGDILSCSLTEAETLSFRALTLCPVEVQLHAGVGAARMASQIWNIPVERTLKEGALSGDSAPCGRGKARIAPQVWSAPVERAPEESGTMSGVNQMTLVVEFGQVYDLTEDQKELAYQDGYTTGETDGAAEGYASGTADEQSVTDSILTRTISGAYRNDRVTSLGQYALRGCTALTYAEFPQVGSVENYALCDCSALSAADIPLAKAVGNYAFNSCSALDSLELPQVTSIGNYCFNNCKALASVELPRIKAIGTGTFNNCTKLPAVDLPMVESIGGSAFYGCAKLATVVIRSTAKVCVLGDTKVFTSGTIANGTGYVYVPDELVDSYKAAANWSTYAAQIRPLSELEEVKHMKKLRA